MQFKQIIGQKLAKQKVLDAIAKQRMAHALMLTGPEGTGKFAFAHAIAQYVNCLHPQDGDSCGTCSNCNKIRKGIHPDIRYILPIISKREGGKQLLSADFMRQFRPLFQNDPYVRADQWQKELGGESKQLMISVHEMRNLKRDIYLKAFEATYKVVIIWQADKINVQGANAFLKLLEEPPDKTLLLMTCSDPSKLLTTIRSRCQQLPLQRIPATLIRDHLQQHREMDSEQATALASISEGSLGNALSLIEESNMTMSQQYMQWLRAVYTGNYAKIQAELEGIIKASKEFQKLFLGLGIKKMRDSLLVGLHLDNLALMTEQEKTFQQNFSKVMDPWKVEQITEIMEKSRSQLSGNANSHMIFSSLALSIHRIMHSNT